MKWLVVVFQNSIWAFESMQMTQSLTFTKVLAALGLCAILTASCADPPPKEIVGRVLDEATLQPIEGAYVLGIYDPRKVPWDFACARSVGVYSDANGIYRLPYERPRDHPRGFPYEVFGIKSGYYFTGNSAPNAVSADLREQVLLRKQDYANPVRSVNTYHVYCSQGKNRPDVEASIEFMKIKLAEYQKMNVEPALIDDVVKMIRDLQLKPASGTAYPPTVTRLPDPNLPVATPADAPADLLPPPNAVATREKENARRGTTVTCRIQPNNVEECCMTLADVTRFPAVAENVRKSGVEAAIDPIRKEICGAGNIVRAFARSSVQVD